MVLKEGGAGGHMQHPFDLADVRDGRSLIDFFQKAANVVKKSQSLKIDGANVSFKVVTNKTGRKEFAVDRGSTKPIDIEGITIDRVGERFPEGHGMRTAIKVLLTIFNEGINKISPELKALGMWENPTIFLNTEYVSETTNVTEYDHSFLAIHGVNQFYEKTNSRTKIRRPGLVRPEGADGKPIRDPSTEIQYDTDVLERLVEKIRPIAEKYDFKVYSSVPTSIKDGLEINYSEALNTPFTVNFDAEDSITKTLEEWLLEFDNPRHIFIKRASDGKKIGALSKEVYTNLLRGTPIPKLVADPEEAKSAIAGAVFYHATRLLGNEILNSLTSPMGDASNHEGVVIRSKQFGQKPVKITGDFILGGMQSGFRESVENEIYSRLVEEIQATKYTILIPGGFKPPHKGHYQMIKFYADRPDVQRVYVISGEAKLRDGVTREMSEKIFNLFGLDNSKVEFINSKEKSPQLLAYELLGHEHFLEDSEGTTIAIGCSDKVDEDTGVADSKRAKDYVRWINGKSPKAMQARESTQLHNIKVGIYPSCSVSSSDEGALSATVLRNALKNGDDETIRSHIPDGVDVEEFKSIVQVQESIDFTSMLFEIIEEALEERTGANIPWGSSPSPEERKRYHDKKKNDKKDPPEDNHEKNDFDPLEEISTSGGAAAAPGGAIQAGSIQGYSSPFPGIRFNKRKKKRNNKQN